MWNPLFPPPAAHDTLCTLCPGQARLLCFFASLPLLLRPPHPPVHMHQRLVAHIQSPHELQRWDLQREVEGRDEGHRAVGPAQPCAGLTRVVTRCCETPGQEAHLGGWV